MEIRVETKPLSRVRDRAVLLYTAKGEDVARAARRAGSAFGAAAALLARRGAYTGALGQTAVLHARRGARIETLVAAGLGDPTARPTDAVRHATAEGARAA